MSRRALFLTAILFLLTVGLFTAPVIASADYVGGGDTTLQVDAPDDPSEETDEDDEDEDEDTSESGGGSEGEDDGSIPVTVGESSGGDGGGGGSDAIGGTELPQIGTNNGAGGTTGDSGDGGGFIANRLEDIREWVAARSVEEAIEIRDNQIEDMNRLLYTLPAPGEPADVWSWYTPDNGWWPDAMDFYWMLGAPAIGALILVGGASFIVDNPTRSRGYLRISLLGIFGVIGGPLFIGAALHTANLLTMGLAPSGSEFFDSPENMAQLATGSALIFILLKVKVGLLIIGVGVLLTQFILTFFLAATLGFSFGLRAVPLGPVNSIGALLFNAFFILPLLKVLQAMLMRFAFMLDWSAYTWLGGALAIIATIVFLLLALVILPWKVMKKIFAAAGVTLGMAAVHQKSEKAKDATVHAARNPRETWNNSVRSVKSGLRNNAAVSAASTARQRVSPNASAAPSGPGSGSSSRSSSTSAARSSSRNAGSSSQGPIPYPSERARSVRRQRRSIRRGGADNATRGDD